MAKPGVYGVDELRAAVKLFATCRDSFNRQFSTQQLVRLYRAWAASSFDYRPDQWSERQIADALDGVTPRWNDLGEPIEHEP